MSHKKLNSRKTISIKLKTKKGIRSNKQRHGKKHRNHVTVAIDYDLFSGIKHSSNCQVVLEVYFLAFQFYLLIDQNETSIRSNEWDLPNDYHRKKTKIHERLK